MTTLEEMVETYWAAMVRSPNSGQDSARDGLLAVIEKHVGPLLNDAFEDGRGTKTMTAEEYVSRIITQLKASPNDQ